MNERHVRRKHKRSQPSPKEGNVYLVTSSVSAAREFAAKFENKRYAFKAYKLVETGVRDLTGRPVYREVPVPGTIDGGPKWAVTISPSFQRAGAMRRVRVVFYCHAIRLKPENEA